MSRREALQSLQDLLDLDPRLHPYQIRVVGHLRSNPKSVVMLDMGMGKTASVLQALRPEHLPALVVGPKRVAEHVWPTEAGIWRPDLSVALAAGGPVKRSQALESGADLVVIGRDNIADVPVGRFSTVVIDELSGFKNRGTKRWKAARRICNEADRVWGLTGTPASSGLMGLWGQLYLIDRGERLETTLTRFRKRYFRVEHRLPNGVVTKWGLRAGSEEKIYDRIRDISISMSASDYLDLPETRVNDVMVPMPPKTARVYESMKKDLVTHLGDDTITAANAAVATGKLSQITAGFLYPDRDDPSQGEETKLLDRAKMDAVAEIVEGTGGPVLVYYRFIEERLRLMDMYPEASTVDDPGVIDRWNAGQVPILLAHPESAGHGLNLQHGGSTIVWASLTWSLEGYLQANARLARQGQTKQVVIHRLICPGTVDEAIASVLAKRASVQDALRDALTV